MTQEIRNPRLRHIFRSFSTLLVRTQICTYLKMAELAFATITATKEVYLICRFIAKTSHSAANHRKERADLEADLEFEQLYIRSFGQLFIRNGGVLTPQEYLNRAWLKKIGEVLEKLRMACGDYAKLASEHDEEYKALSPFLNPHDHLPEASIFNLPTRRTNNNNNNETGYLSITNSYLDHPSQHGDMDIALRSASNGVSNPLSAKLSLTPNKAANLLPDYDWRWALSEKKKLKKILSIFQEATRKMKDLLQLAIATNPQYSTAASGAEENLQAEDRQGYQVLGLEPHLTLRLVSHENAPNALPKIRNGTLHMPPGSHHFAMGRYFDQEEGTETATAQNVIAEFKTLEEDSLPFDEENLLRLARLLAVTDNSDLKILPFRCVMQYSSPRSYAFLFGFPAGTLESTPASLHDLINPTNARRHNLALTYRFYIAYAIAKSLAAFHADEWVHKSLSSSAIMFFYSESGNLDFTSPYLTSFEYSRATTTDTTWTYDDDPEKNLYRHPDRQRPPSISFNKLHDLWALGVILLEIGLWETAASIQHTGVVKRALSIPVDPHVLREIYLDRVNHDLAHNMGSAYALAVKTCLLGDFGCGASDAGLLLAVHDRVIDRLNVESLALSYSSAVAER